MWHRLSVNRQHLLVGAVLLVFTLVFLQNAWISDDAQITFRSVEQLFAGNGPRWNPHERVQTFTHPLWFFCLAAIRLVSTNLYATCLVLSWGLGIALLLMLRSAARREPLPWVLGVSGLLSSRAYVDYTSSGLENPLSCVVLVCLVREALKPGTAVGHVARVWERPIERVAGLTALAGLCRHDYLLLCLPILIWVVWRERSRGWRSSCAGLLLGFTPMIAWTIFSIIYYGVPVPNTAYAKLNHGVSNGLLWQQGLRYLVNLVTWDLFTAVSLVAGIAVALRAKGALAAIAIGQLIYVVYVVRIGGDFMAGRFFSPMFAVSAFVILREVRLSRRAIWIGLCGLAVWNVLAVDAPIKTWSGYRETYDWTANAGIADEKGAWFKMGSLWHWLRPEDNMHMPPGVVVEPLIGRSGYEASLDAILIDPMALADPLLSRLPATEAWRIGHFKRDVPDGYVETLQTGENRIKNPLIHELYDRIHLVVSGPLFDANRWAAILDLNLRPVRFDCGDPPCRMVAVNPNDASTIPPLAPHDLGRASIEVNGATVHVTGWAAVSDFASGVYILVMTTVAPADDSPFWAGWRPCPEGASSDDRRYCGFDFDVKYDTEEHAKAATRQICIYLLRGGGAKTNLGGAGWNCAK